MTTPDELKIIRRAYAKHVLASVEVDDPALEAAFASVAREDFLGPGPWPILRPSGYVPTPSADPVYLYADLLVGLVPERGLNNGMPSYHARIVAEAGIRAGDPVVHVGAGTGYYTAIMAHLAGPGGRVTAIELDPSLAESATANLLSAPSIRVIQGDGARVAFDPADVIYVNAGVTRPAGRWLDGLAEGGRLILPLTARKRLPPDGTGTIARHGAVFRIQRVRDEFLARWISHVGIYPCEGSRDKIAEAALDAALRQGGWERVTRLYRTDDLPEERCWLRAAGWSLAYR